MNEHHEQLKQFTIKKAMLDDAEAIGEVQLQSWKETYPNEELGITKDWIHDTVSHLTQKSGSEFRRKTIQKSLETGSSTLYLVVKDSESKAKGFLHVTRKEPIAYFDAIYLAREAIGTGIAHDLMQHALEFLKGLPVEVRVISYNHHALKFYEKYGFKANGELAELYEGKIPITVMIRKADS